MKKLLRLATLLSLAWGLCVTTGFAQVDGTPPGDAGTEQEAPALPPMMLRLRDGGILWGSIMQHDPEGIRFERADTGGLVRLPWTWLDPEEEGGLRLRFGYVDAATDELMVDADRFYLRDGTEITGLIVSRTNENIFVKTASVSLPVPKSQIAGSSTIVKVPALDIYTKDELYQQKVLELQSRLLTEGTAGAQANFEIAEFSERLFDYPHAVHHFNKAAELDPDYAPDVVAAAIARTEMKALQQDQVDMLSEIDLMRARKRFDKAVELIQRFPNDFPDSPLMEDWNKMRERVLKYQERELESEVVRLWHYWTVKLISEAVRKKPTYQEVLAYLDEALAEDLRQAIVKELERLAPGIQPDEMQAFWEKRKGGRRRDATYGAGTWLLGEERALAELQKKAEGPKAEKGSQAEERKKIEERVQRYLKNQELAQKAKTGGESEEDDPERFWKDWTLGGRRLWAQAYFIENSGLFRLEQVLFNNCRGCGGIGVREVISLGSAVSGDSGGSRLLKCTTCRGIARVRRIKYR